MTRTLCRAWRSHYRRGASALWCVAVFCTAAGHAQTAPDGALRLAQTITLQTPGSLEHMIVDRLNERAFVAANETVEVVDLKSSQTLASIAGRGKPEELIYFRKCDCVAYSTSAGMLRILDPNTLKVITEFAVGGSAGFVGLDPQHDLAYVARSGATDAEDDSHISLIDLVARKNVGEIRIRSRELGQMVLEHHGPRGYVNDTAAGDVVVLDLDTRSVVSRWTLEDAAGNSAIALDEKDHRLFIGSRTPGTLTVLDTQTGKTVARLASLSNVRDIAYDATLKRVYLSGGEGYVDVFQQTGPDSYARLERVTTGAGAATSKWVPELSRLYVEAPPLEASQRGRILVYDAMPTRVTELYPPPLMHTPANHPAERVLIISVPGLRAVNFANFVASHPRSALAELAERGVTYTNAHVPWPDSASGTATMASGGSPLATGVLSSDGYDRSARRAGESCMPAAVALHLTPKRAEALLAEGACAPLEAHDLIRVNSVFDVVHAAHGRTAWADSNAALADLLRGPSGAALDEVFVASASTDGSTGVASAEERDRQCVDAVMRWMASGTKVPQSSGLSLFALDAAQRSVPLATTAAEGAARSVKQSPLEHVDAQVGRIVTALKTEHLFDSTWIIVTAPHGSLGDTANLRVIDNKQMEQVARSAAGDGLARVVVATAGMIWLKDPDMTATVVNAYRAKMLELGIGAIYSGEKLKLVMNTAREDSRMPDVILDPQAGVVWASDGEWPEHLGGFGDDENHVAMLIAGRQLTGRVYKTWVSTGQLAPLILRALGLEVLDLQALHEEHVPALPGIF